MIASSAAPVALSRVASGSASNQAAYSACSAMSSATASRQRCGRLRWSAGRRGARCRATIRVRGRIASPENVPEPSSFASPNLLPLPHRALLEFELLFPLFDISYLLLWALWGCGRRARVVQAQRQIHRALGKAGVIKPSTRRAGRTGAVCLARRRAGRSACMGHRSGAGASSGHACVSL